MAGSIESRKRITVAARKIADLEGRGITGLNSTTRAIKNLNDLGAWEFTRARLEAIRLGDESFLRAVQEGPGPRAPDAFARVLINTLTLGDRIRVIKDFLNGTVDD